MSPLSALLGQRIASVWYNSTILRNLYPCRWSWQVVWFGNCSRSVDNRNTPRCPAVRPPQSCFIAFGDKDWRLISPPGCGLEAFVTFFFTKQSSGEYSIITILQHGNKYREGWFQRKLYITMNIPTSTYFFTCKNWNHIFWRGTAGHTISKAHFSHTQTHT